MIYIIMGVSGSGKTTLGQSLVCSLENARFFDADDFHPNTNIEKMSSGIPLTDKDRKPWLENLSAHLQNWKFAYQNVVLACSALKEKYRQILSQSIDSSELKYILLNSAKNTLLKQISSRKDHFMSSSLLDSQINILEIPDYAIKIDISIPIEQQVKKILDTH